MSFNKSPTAAIVNQHAHQTPIAAQKLANNCNTDYHSLLKDAEGINKVRHHRSVGRMTVTAQHPAANQQVHMFEHQKIDSK